MFSTNDKNQLLRKIIVFFLIFIIIEKIILICFFNLEILANTESILLHSLLIYFIRFNKRQIFFLDKIFNSNTVLICYLILLILGTFATIYLFYGYLTLGDLTLLEMGRAPYCESIFNFIFGEIHCTKDITNTTGSSTDYKSFNEMKDLKRLMNSAGEGVAGFGTIAGAYGAGVFLSGPKTTAVLMKTVPKGAALTTAVAFGAFKAFENYNTSSSMGESPVVVPKIGCSKPPLPSPLEDYSLLSFDEGYFVLFIVAFLYLLFKRFF